MAKTVVAVLNSFFNSGDGVSIESTGGDNCPATVAGTPVKRPAKEWVAELKALTTEEKRTLAEQVCAVTGEQLVAA